MLWLDKMCSTFDVSIIYILTIVILSIIRKSWIHIPIKLVIPSAIDKFRTRALCLSLCCGTPVRSVVTPKYQQLTSNKTTQLNPLHLVRSSSQIFPFLLFLRALNIPSHFDLCPLRPFFLFIYLLFSFHFKIFKFFNCTTYLLQPSSWCLSDALSNLRRPKLSVPIHSPIALSSLCQPLSWCHSDALHIYFDHRRRCLFISILH